MATIPDLGDAAYYRVKKIEGHQCNLVCEEDSICHHITSGFFVPLRRAIRKSMIISPHDPRAKFLAKSRCRMKIEENRHLQRYYFMIHPYSDFYYYWLAILTITHVCLLLATPIHGMQLIPQEDPSEHLAELVIMMYFLATIIVSFFVGYYDQQSDQIVLTPRKVAVKYLCSHFIFDVLSTCKYSFISRNHHTWQAVWISRAQVVCRMSRLFTINEFINVVQMKKNIPSYICKPLKIILISVLFIVWLSYFNFLIVVKNLPVNMGKAQYILLTFSHVIRKFCLCDIFAGNYGNLETTDLYAFTTTLHVAKLIEIYLMAQISQIFTSYMKVNHSYHELLYQINTYIRVKDLPNRLKRRILKYLNFRFQYFVFQENYLVQNLSLPLKNDILWHTCQNLVTKVETFKELPPHVMIKMVSMMKPEIYLPNDVVVNAGEVGNEMFFTRVGVLAVFTESGKEICHLAEGSHFGEIALLLNEKRVASVVAIDFCQLYRLTKRDFQEVIDPHPSIKADIMKIAKDRFMELKLITGK